MFRLTSKQKAQNHTANYCEWHALLLVCMLSPVLDKPYLPLKTTASNYLKQSHIDNSNIWDD